MNDVRIVNYTLIAALLLLMATYMISMQSLSKANSYDRDLYTVTAFRL